MLINIQDARGLFTNKIVALVKEMSEPTMFFKSFFKTKISSSLELAIDVKRMGRPIAVDIKRGTDGKVTRMDKTTEKAFIPPYFDYAFNLTGLDGYKRLFGKEPNIDSGQLADMISIAAEGVTENVDRINRTYEKYSAEALLTGIVQLENATNIDFKRDASMIVAYDNTKDWNGTYDPGKDMKAGADKIRSRGNFGGGVFNVVLGSNALVAYTNNAIIQKKADLQHSMNLTLDQGAMIGTGATPQGIYKFGSYIFQIWGYEGLYDDGEGTTQKYMDENAMIILPNNQSFTFGYGGVPIMSDSSENATPIVVPGEFAYYEAIDRKNAQKFYGVRSAGMPILTYVDRVFTQTVVDPNAGVQG